MSDFELVWRRIVALEGEVFHQRRGQPFTYQVRGECVRPSTTNRQLARSQFQRAFERMPVYGPGELNDLQGPSYLFAILTDPRVTRPDPREFLAAAASPRGRAGAVAPPAMGAGPARRPSTLPLGPGVEMLADVDPRRALLVMTCSASKVRGGDRPGQASTWCSPELLQARQPVLQSAESDLSRVMPAWQRYTGGFYRSGGAALAEAASGGRVVILSGGYGIVRAGEPIGWYEKTLRLADWPRGLLESILIAEARRAQAGAVVAFAPASTGYAAIVRRTPWRGAGIQALLVTITEVREGAMAEVPRRLGLAFAAFWHQHSGGYPPGTTVEPLS